MTKALARRVAKTTSATDSDRLVVVFLAEQANKHNAVEITDVSLAAQAKCPIRTTRRALKRLVDLGEVAIERRARRPSRLVVIERGVNSAPPAKPQHVGSVSKGGHSVSKGGHSVSPHNTYIPLKHLTRTRVEGFAQTWNDHCDTLPRLRKAPESPPATRLILAALESADNDLALLGRAIARAAADPHYREHRFGFESFCRHVDRWLDDRDPKAVMRAARTVKPSAPARQLTDEELVEQRKAERRHYAKQVGMSDEQLQRELREIEEGRG